MKLNDEHIEAHWRDFQHDWDMFVEGAAYETFPDLTPWQLLEIKVNAWHSHLAEALMKEENK